MDHGEEDEHDVDSMEEATQFSPQVGHQLPATSGNYIFPLESTGSLYTTCASFLPFLVIFILSFICVTQGSIFRSENDIYPPPF
jgi:hypothetical protein